MGADEHVLGWWLSGRADHRVGIWKWVREGGPVGRPGPLVVYQHAEGTPVSQREARLDEGEPVPVEVDHGSITDAPRVALEQDGAVEQGFALSVPSHPVGGAPRLSVGVAAGEVVEPELDQRAARRVDVGSAFGTR